MRKQKLSVLIFAVATILIVSCADKKKPDVPVPTEYCNELVELADDGYPEAMHRLALCYLQGEGTAVQIEEGMALLKKAAGDDYAPAQCDLGRLYRDGQGVEQSYEKAVELFQKSAGQGYPEGKYELAVMYLTGKGVPAKIEQGFTLLDENVRQNEENSVKLWESIFKGRSSGESTFARKYLACMAQELNECCPQKWPNGVTMESVALNGNTFSYNYMVEMETMNQAKLNDKKPIIDTFRANEDNKMFVVALVESNVNIVYNYTTSIGKKYTIVLDKGDLSSIFPR